MEAVLDDFLGRVYRLAELNDLEGATDKVFRFIDNLLLGGDFHTCNEILRQADVKQLPSSLLRSFLTITAAAKDKLPARADFYQEAFAEMVRLKGEEKAHRLLGPLK